MEDLERAQEEQAAAAAAKEGEAAELAAELAALTAATEEKDQCITDQVVSLRDEAIVLRAA